MVSAAHLVRRGRVYDLAHVLHAAVPAFPGRTFTQTLDMPQAVPGPHGLGFVIERVARAVADGHVELRPGPR